MAKKTRKVKVKKQKQKQGPDFPVKKIKVKIIGIGNGGGVIVADISRNIKRVQFLAVNTDGLALSKIKRKVKTFQLGQDITGGFGTGMDFSAGQSAAEKQVEKIEKILQDCDLCILIACLGGGTGSGIAPVFARVSKKLGNLTYGIFTLPFGFEGEKKLEIAKHALKELGPFVNVITIIPNESIFKIVDKKLPLKKALATINQVLCFNLQGLINIVYKPGIVNIDFADLKTILKGQGQLSYLSRASAKGQDRAKKAFQKVLANPFYPYNTSKARKILFDIAGPANLSISEVAAISNAIFNSVQKGSKIIFGVSRQPEKDKVEITLLAVGCEMKNLFPKAVKKPRPPLKLQQEIKKKKLTQPKKQAETSQEKKPVKQEKGKIKIKNIEKSKNSNAKKTRVRKNALQLQKAIEEIEKEIRQKEEIWETPAFLRRKS